MAARFEFPCFSCGHTLAYPEMPGFRATCEKCGEDAHVCKNCRFYDPKVYNECAEPSAEVVREKTRANFCEFFEPGGAGRGDSQKVAADLKAQAEALFRKK